MKNLKYLLFVVVLFCINETSSQAIKKGFEAFEIYDYFKAKMYFEKYQKKFPSASSYGLSLIFLNEKNPFHNPDSALYRIEKAESQYPNIKDSQKQKLKEKLNFDSTNIETQKQNISAYYFKIASDENTFDSYQYFINTYPWSNLMDSAITKRNYWAFESAKKQNTYEAYSSFINSYPKAEQLSLAKVKYDSLYFLAKTNNQTISGYQEFIINNSNNPYTAQAQKELYRLYTTEKLKEGYLAYINDNKEFGAYLKEAWENLFTLWLNNYSKQELDVFVNTFPESSEYLQEKIDLGYKMAGSKVLPIKDGNKWFVGVYDNNQLNKIKEDGFEFLEWDEGEGIGQFYLEDSMGYVNKWGEIIISAKYDEGLSFKNGFAIVDYNEKTGLINTLGYELIPFKYDNISRVNEDIYILEEGRRYSIYSIQNKGDLIRGNYDFIEYNRTNKLIEITQGKKKALFNLHGDTVLPFIKGFSHSISGGVFVVKDEEGNFGVIDSSLDTIRSLRYDYIGEFESDYVVIANNGYYGYLDSMGKYMIKPELKVDGQLFSLFEFKDNYAKRSLNGKWGIIDTTGKKYIASIFEDIIITSENIYPVKKRGKWGVTNKRLKLLIPYEYDQMLAPVDSIFIVSNENKWGIINLEEELLPLKFKEMKWIKNDLIKAKSDSGYSIYSKHNWTEPIFKNKDQVFEMYQDYLYLYQNDKLMIYDMVQSKVIYREL